MLIGSIKKLWNNTNTKIIVGVITSFLLIFLRVAYRNMQEWFGGAGIWFDDVIFGLALSFLGSTIFYYMVVYFPEHRHKRVVMPAIESACALVVTHGNFIFHILSQITKHEERQVYTESDILNMWEKFEKDTPGKMVSIWYEHAGNLSKMINSNLNNIIYINFLDSELREMLVNIKCCIFISTMASYEKDAAFLAPASSHDLINLYDLISVLKKYRDEKLTVK